MGPPRLILDGNSKVNLVFHLFIFDGIRNAVVLCTSILYVSSIEHIMFPLNTWTKIGFYSFLVVYNENSSPRW